MAILGVDVASYQAVAFPTKGLAFAFVKATEGTGYVNPKHAGQVAHARAAGLVVGHYHFIRPGSGVAQADYFLAKAGIHTGDILALDWEDGAVGAAERDAFIARVKSRAPGHKVVLYCNLSFWNGHSQHDGDGLWIADPSAPTGKPRVSRWVFHQYSWAGGIDRNVANFKDVAALKVWAGVTKAPAPAPKPVPKPAPAPAPAPKPVVTLDQRVTALEARVATLEGKVK
jgi:GH25 family lysozyme M1 (1,4-beta-N-acetylmuramidase)